MRVSKKNKQAIVGFIERTLTKSAFTWRSDIAEHSIWGFKNAPYKNWDRAMVVVSDIVDQCVNLGILVIEPSDTGLASTIHRGPCFGEKRLFSEAIK